MLRVLFAMLFVGAVVASMTGCRASGEIDDSSNITSPR